MCVYIYYCKWNKEPESHDLLRRAVCRYPADLQNGAFGFVYEATLDSDEVCETQKGGESAVPVPAADWELAVHDGGKPYFPAHPEIHFSISHSGDYWACAVGRRKVGLDLQQENQTTRAEKLAKRFFHPLEQAYLQSVEYRDFTLIWACKESYLKYTGEGIAGGMEHFSVVDADGRFVLRGSGGRPLPAVQAVIPFEKEYKLVLTTENSTEYRTENLRL